MSTSTSGRRPWNRNRTITQGSPEDQQQRSFNTYCTILPVPEYMDKEHEDIWLEVLWTAPHEELRASDYHTLESYVDIIFQRRKIASLLEEQKVVQPRKKLGKGKKKEEQLSGGMLVRRNGTLHPNPLMTMYRALSRDLATYASLLRLTGKHARATQSEAERASRVASSPLKSARSGLLGGRAVATSSDTE